MPAGRRRRPGRRPARAVPAGIIRLDAAFPAITTSTASAPHGRTFERITGRWYTKSSRLPSHRQPVARCSVTSVSTRATSRSAMAAYRSACWVAIVVRSPCCPSSQRIRLRIVRSSSLSSSFVASAVTIPWKSAAARWARTASPARAASSSASTAARRRSSPARVRRWAANRNASGSSAARTSLRSATSEAVNSRTTAQDRGRGVTRPSPASARRASRTGTRLTPSSAARSRSTSRSPGPRTPSRISSRSCPVTRPASDSNPLTSFGIP